MYFANPWGLLGLLALPAIAIIHLYHRRFPPLMVAGAHLWGAEAQVRTAGRRIDQLPITATLLLELLAALLLSLVLSEPRLGDLTKVTHLVVVLDNSASMMGTPAGGRNSFRDRAINELKNRAGALERGSVVTLILTGHRPVMLAGPAVPWEDAEPLLADWHPRQTKHEFQSAWDLAAQLAEESGELLFLTDVVPGEKTPVPNQMEVVSVGQRVDNVAITTARWSFESVTAKGSVYIRIGNLGKQTANVTVQGKAGDTVIFNKTVSIPANGAVPLETEVAGGLGILTVDIQSPSDGLKIDNRVTLVEPKVRLLTVAETLPQDHSAKPFVRRVLDLMPDLQTGSAERAHLLIGPASELPPSRRDLWWFGIGPIDSSEQSVKESKNLRGPYLLEKRNALLDGVVLGGVVWGGVQPSDYKLTPLISAGETRLLARLNGTQTTAYLMNIDMERSNLGESPDWPILLSNLVELRRDNLPGLRRWNYRLDEIVRFRFRDQNSEKTESDEQPSGDLVIEHGGKSRPLVRTSTIEISQLDDPGIYSIKDRDQLVGRFAVNFHDVDESKLTGLRPGIREPIRRAKSAGIILDNPYSWLIMLGIILILLVAFMDWSVLRPKRR